MSRPSSSGVNKNQHSDSSVSSDAEPYVDADEELDAPRVAQWVDDDLEGFSETDTQSESSAFVSLVYAMEIIIQLRHLTQAALNQGQVSALESNDQNVQR